MGIGRTEQKEEVLLVCPTLPLTSRDLRMPSTLPRFQGYWDAWPLGPHRGKRGKRSCSTCRGEQGSDRARCSLSILSLFDEETHGPGNKRLLPLLVLWSLASSRCDHRSAAAASPETQDSTTWAPLSSRVWHAKHADNNYPPLLSQQCTMGWRR